MRAASKFITLSAAAFLAGGANHALAASYGDSRSYNDSRSSYSDSRMGGMSGEERSRLREIVRDIPRLSSIGSTEIRIDGFVPRSVRQAAAPLPPEVRQMHPRFSRDRAFRFRDQVVILNPATSRIVAIVKTPA